MKSNILLIVLDSVRAKNTTIHDYHRDTTPTLNKLVQSDFVQYTQARSPGIYSITSLLSMFTGLEVEEHMVFDDFSYNITDGATVWELLSDEHQYSTGVFSYNANFSGESPLNDVFDYKYHGSNVILSNENPLKEFIKSSDSNKKLSKYIEFCKWCMRNDQKFRSFMDGIIIKAHNLSSSPYLSQKRNPSADKYVDQFLKWEKSQSQPWAACINFYESHHEYYPDSSNDCWGGPKMQKRQHQLRPHPWGVHGKEISWSFWNELENLYDGTILQIDKQIGRLFNELKDRGEYENTFIVITSNHGDGFGEYSRVRPNLRTAGHVAGIHECLLHVPLLVSFPWSHDPTRINQLSSTKKFYHSVVDLANGDLSEESFIPTDSKVLSTSTNIERNPRQAGRAARYIKDLDEFSGIARAVYQQDRDGEIYKHIKWGSDTATVMIDQENQSIEIVEDDCTDKKVCETFSLIQNKEIRELRINSISELEPDPISPQTMECLNSIGYKQELPFIYRI